MQEGGYSYTLEWWLASVLYMDRIEINVELSGLWRVLFRRSRPEEWMLVMAIQHGIVVICGEERLHISMCSDNAMMTPDLTTPTRHFWLHLGGSAMQGFQRSQRSIHAS